MKRNPGIMGSGPRFDVDQATERSIRPARSFSKERVDARCLPRRRFSIHSKRRLNMRTRNMLAAATAVLLVTGPAAAQDLRPQTRTTVTPSLRPPWW